MICSTTIPISDNKKFFIDTAYIHQQNNNVGKLVSNFYFATPDRGYDKPFLTLSKDVPEQDITERIMQDFHGESCKTWRSIYFTFTSAYPWLEKEAV